MGDGKIMTDIESQIFQMYEEDRAFQKIVDALNKIGCTSFILSKSDLCFAQVNGEEQYAIKKEDIEYVIPSEVEL